MMFDEKSLEPLYKLALGQSRKFSFSSAENGTFSLINRAKKKIEVEKCALTKPLPPTKERSKMENFADAEGRRNQSAKKEGRWKRLISRLSKTRKLSRAV
jgi:DNA mismatch repair protein MutS2